MKWGLFSKVFLLFGSLSFSSFSQEASSYLEEVYQTNPELKEVMKGDDRESCKFCGENDNVPKPVNQLSEIWGERNHRFGRVMLSDGVCPLCGHKVDDHFSHFDKTVIPESPEALGSLADSRAGAQTMFALNMKHFEELDLEGLMEEGLATNEEEKDRAAQKYELKKKTFLRQMIRMFRDRRGQESTLKKEQQEQLLQKIFSLSEAKSIRELVDLYFSAVSRDMDDSFFLLNQILVPENYRKFEKTDLFESEVLSPFEKEFFKDSGIEGVSALDYAIAQELNSTIQFSLEKTQYKKRKDILDQWNRLNPEKSGQLDLLMKSILSLEFDQNDFLFPDIPEEQPNLYRGA